MYYDEKKLKAWSTVESFEMLEVNISQQLPTSNNVFLFFCSSEWKQD